MPEIRRREDVSLQIAYTQEYVEEERPTPGLAYPVLSPNPYIKASVSGNNKVLCFLAITTLICLGALVLAPVPPVQGPAIAIWLLSLKFAQSMLNKRGSKT